MPRILIVDDEWVTRVEIEEMLIDLGYEVAGQAETGAEAIEMVRNLEPDLIIMDVMMPGEMNGIDATRVIKAKWGTPIVFITGYGDPDCVEAAKEIAPFGYVMKPFDEKEVHAFIEIALSKRELELKVMKANESLKRANLVLQEEIACRKKTEKALRESEDKYRMLTENAKDMIYRMSLPDGNYEYVSPASIDLTGYTPEAFYESPMLIQKNIHPDWVGYLREQWASLMDGKAAPFYEYQIIHKSGEVRWMNQRNVLILDNNGQPKAIEGIVTDVTNRKQAEEALRESEEQYRILVENAGEAISVAQEGMLKFVNKKTEELSGLTRTELLSTTFDKFIHADDRSLVLERHERRQQGIAVPSTYSFRLIGKSGDAKWVESNAVEKERLEERLRLCRTQDPGQ